MKQLEEVKMLLQKFIGKQLIIAMDSGEVIDGTLDSVDEVTLCLASLTETKYVFIEKIQTFYEV